jgi:hypothetical protein
MRYASKVRHLEKGVLLREGKLPAEWVDSNQGEEGTWLNSSGG